MALLGIDVSRHQGAINWNAVKSVGNVFAFCKATDGTSYPYTGYFKTQFAQMKAAGLVPGAYHWLQPGNGAAQAEYFVRTIGDVRGVLCALDHERNPSGTFASYTTALSFAVRFKELTGGHPLMLYTGRWFWVPLLGNPNGSVIGPLWHSEYETTDAEIADGPELDNYGGWSAATFWQYTSSGSVPGVSGSVDRNLFYGTLADLGGLAGDGPPPSPNKDDKMYAMVQGDQTPYIWLTDFQTKRHMHDWDEVGGYIYAIRASGGICLGDVNAPLVWPQAYVDRIDRADLVRTPAGGDQLIDSTETINTLRSLHSGNYLSGGDLTWLDQKLQPVKDSLAALSEQVAAITPGPVTVTVDPQVIEDVVREVFADAGQE